MSIEKLHNKVFEKFLKNKTLSLFMKDVDLFLDKYLDKIFYKPCILRLQEAICQRHYIAIYSSSPFFLVEKIAKVIKVNEYIATEYVFDDEKRFKSIFSIVNGKKKALFAKNLLKRFNSNNTDLTVYTDSIDDIELLNLASYKVIVNPGLKLKKLAKKNQWEII
jgi:phosphoserine phosphatase